MFPCSHPPPNLIGLSIYLSHPLSPLRIFLSLLSCPLIPLPDLPPLSPPPHPPPLSPNFHFLYYLPFYRPFLFILFSPKLSSLSLPPTSLPSHSPLLSPCLSSQPPSPLSTAPSTTYPSSSLVQRWRCCMPMSHSMRMSSASALETPSPMSLARRPGGTGAPSVPTQVSSLTTSSR